MGCHHRHRTALPQNPDSPATLHGNTERAPAGLPDRYGAERAPGCDLAVSYAGSCTVTRMMGETDWT
jgi:hypothetical protein